MKWLDEVTWLIGVKPNLVPDAKKIGSSLTSRLRVNPIKGNLVLKN